MKDKLDTSIFDIVEKLTGSYSFNKKEAEPEVDPLEEEVKRIKKERELEKRRPPALRKKDKLNEIFDISNFSGKFADRSVSKVTSPNEDRVFFVKITVSAPSINKEMFTAMKESRDVKKVVPYRLTHTGIELGVVASHSDDVAYVLRDFISGLGFERNYYYLEKVIDPTKIVSAN
jgi:hypothetical protein